MGFPLLPIAIGGKGRAMRCNSSRPKLRSGVSAPIPNPKQPPVFHLGTFGEFFKCTVPAPCRCLYLAPLLIQEGLPRGWLGCLPLNKKALPGAIFNLVFPPLRVLSPAAYQNLMIIIFCILSNIKPIRTRNEKVFPHSSICSFPGAYAGL